MKKVYHFNIVFRPEKEGGFTVIVPSLPGCVSYGKTLDEAEGNITEAIEGYLEVRESLHEEIQDDSQVFLKSINLSYA